MTTEVHQQARHDRMRPGIELVGPAQYIGHHEGVKSVQVLVLEPQLDVIAHGHA